MDQQELQVPVLLLLTAGFNSCFSRLCSKSQLKTPSDVAVLKDYLTEIWTDLAMMVGSLQHNQNFKISNQKRAFEPQSNV